VSKKEESILEFLKTSIVGSFLTIVRIGTGLGRAKVSAIVLGTAGVGLLAQGNQLQLFASMLGSLGSLQIGAGLVNQLAHPDHSQQSHIRQNYISTVFTVQIILSCTLLLFSFVGSRYIADFAFSNPNEGLNSFLVILSIPFTVMTTGYFDSILFAAHRYNLYARALVISSILGLVVFFILVRSLGVTGAFISIPVIAILNFVMLMYQVSKVEPLSNLFKFKIDVVAVRKLLKFSSVMFTGGLMGYGSLLLIRREILSTLGTEANGILQVPLAITSYYAPFITQPLFGRLHPVVSSKGNTSAARDELSMVLRVVAIFGTISAVGIMTLGEFMVRLIYSKDFGQASELMVPQLIGDYFYFLALTVSVYFLGVAHLRAYFSGWIIYYSLYFGITVFSLKSLHILALPVGYLISGVFMAVLTMIWFVRSHPKESSFVTLRVVLLGALVVSCQAAVCTYFSYTWDVYRFLIPALCAIWASYRVSKKGWRSLLAA
jgi:O-antigen/teichoic acid export membrane protein